MKYKNYGLIIVLFAVLFGIFLPVSSGIFFNPGGGFSLGGVHVSVDQEQATVSPGDTAVFNITIANDSDLPVIINATIISSTDWKTSIEPSFIVLQSHQIENIHLKIKVPKDADNGTNAEVIILYMVSFPETGEQMNVPATTVRTVVRDNNSTPNYLPLMIAASSCICLAAFFSTDKGKYAWGFLLAPLYTRLHKNNVLSNETRNGLFQFIQDHPGQCFSEIKRSLKLKNGVLAHHLKTLEREHYIKSRKDGMYRRFYLRHQPVPNITLNPSQKKILEFLLTNPGTTQADIAVNLGVSRQTINYHLLAMEQMGAVRITREGRLSYCYPKVRPGPVQAEAM